MRELDKRLNLILNLTEGPDSRSTAEKVNDSLNEMYKTVERVVGSSKREQEILRELNKEEERRNRLLERRAELVKKGASTSAVDADGARSVAKTRALGTELANTRGQRAADKAQLQEQRKAWEANTKAHEKEEERRAQNAIRAMKKQEKERDKFIRAAKGSLDGLLSLAESAALAYASMMNIDESNVKKWLQWMGAIKSVGAGLKGIYDIYKSVHSVIRMIQAARVAETAATTAATVATKVNTAAELENCAAKSCGLGGGGGKGGGMLGGLKGLGGKIKGFGGAAGRAIGQVATKSLPVLAGIATFAAAAEGTSRLINIAQGGGGREGIFGATAGMVQAWGSSNATADQLKNQQELSKRIKNRKSGYDMEMDLGVAERRRENRLYGVEQREGFAGLYATESKRTSAARVVEMERSKALGQNEAELRSKGSSYANAATEEKRAEGYKMLAQAEEALIQKLKSEIQIKKDSLDAEMRAQEKQLANAQKYYDKSEKWLDKATKKSDELNSKFDKMASGLLGMSRSKGQRALDVRERMASGDENVTYREMELARQAGLVNTPEMEERARQVEERELRRRGYSGEYIEKAMEDRKAAEAEKKEAKMEVLMAMEDLNIEQAITVDLKSDHEEQINALVDKLRPQLEEALKRRDEAIVKAFENDRWKAMIEEEINKLKQELEANT